MAPEDLSRVAQLTQRTNQFNCTTHRLTEGELQRTLGQAELLTVSVQDRFGDYGLVGAVIFKARAGAIEAETFLLSCRVLGRGVEHRVLGYLGELARDRGADYVDVHFVPSEKNQPAWDFLENVGSAFKQPLNGGYTFRFPASFAAETTFEPEAAWPKSRRRRRTNGSQGLIKSRRRSPYQDIARMRLRQSIQRAIEAKATGRRPAAKLCSASDGFGAGAVRALAEVASCRKVGTETTSLNWVVIRRWPFDCSRKSSPSREETAAGDDRQAPTVERLIRFSTRGKVLAIAAGPNSICDRNRTVFGAWSWWRRIVGLREPGGTCRRPAIYGINRAVKGLENLLTGECAATFKVCFPSQGPYCSAGIAFMGM